jgi:GH25 family lysozyme M1 (1,4-beta-N-acetylmuramidase)
MPNGAPGVDVSQWQGDVDFVALAKSGEVFSLARALYGLVKDTMFDHYYAQTKAAGMVRGGYQFGRPCHDTAQASAQAYVNVVNAVGGFDGFPPIIDLEYGVDSDGLSPAQLTDWVLAWMAAVKTLTGMPGMLYTSTAFITERLVASRLAGIPLWDAQYSGSTLPNTGPYLKLKVWQYAAEQNNVAKIPGIPLYNQVDEDVFAGTKADLIAWLEEVKGVQKTTVTVNGVTVPAVIVDNQTYPLWTALQNVPGTFSTAIVGGKRQFTVTAPVPAIQPANTNVQAGIAKVQEGLNLLKS